MAEPNGTEQPGTGPAGTVDTGTVGTVDIGTEPVRCSVPDAARRLGITERAVRKRIQAGTLPAERFEGRWLVMLSSDVTHPSRPGHKSHQSHTSSSAREQRTATPSPSVPELRSGPAPTSEPGPEPRSVPEPGPTSAP